MSASNPVNPAHRIKDDLNLGKNPVNGSLNGKSAVALKQLDRLNTASHIFAAVAIALLVTTVVLLGLAQADYVHPFSGLYAFTGAIAAFCVVKMIECCQGCVARENKIDLKDYFAVREPLPKREKKDNKKK